MRKQTKYILLGGLVVVATVILVLPMFQHTHQETVEVAAAPTFPKEASIVTPHEETASTEQLAMPEQVISPADETILSTTRPDVVQQIEKKDKSPIPPQEAPAKLISHTETISPLKNKSSKKLQTRAAKPAKPFKQAWAVQMGSFKQKDNALRLANQLRRKGYNAFILNQTTISGRLTRVLVGPKYEKNSALELAQNLEKTSKIHGIVVNYHPLSL